MAQFSIDNPTAISQLVIGKTYYFDITDADPAAVSDSASAASGASDDGVSAVGANAQQN